MTNVDGTLYFAGKDRRHGIELWRSDGTRRGTRMVKDISSGSARELIPEQLTAVGKILYFTARDGIHGPELWRSNGTARGTRLVRDIVPGQGAIQPRVVHERGRHPLLRCQRRAPEWDPDRAVAKQRHRGTTGLVKQLAKINYPTAIGGSLYFAASDGTNAGLWRSDGTPSGTVLVKGFQAALRRRRPCYLTNVAGHPLLHGADGTTAVSGEATGPSAGTTLVKQGLSAYELTAVGRTLYFATIDYSDSWLWRSDGTDAGTTPDRLARPHP